MDAPETATDKPWQEAQPEKANVTAKSLVSFQGVQSWLIIWVPIAASLLSLIIAVVSIIVATYDPGVVVILPSRVVMDDADLGADTPFHPDNVYLQPNFVGTGNNNRIEVMSSLKLTIAPEGGGSPTEAAWIEQGTWDFVDGVIDSAGSTVSTRSFVYAADAAPLLISPNNAQQPLCVFALPPGFEFRPNVRYVFTLTAERVVAGKPLTAVGHVILSQEEIDYYKTYYRTLKYIDAVLEQVEQ
jgi:hypothetical protein